MSDVNFGTGTFRVTMDASQMGSATGQALGYMQSLEQAVATNWWGIRNLGMAFAALPAAVAAGIGASVRAAMQWEDAMAGVERTTYNTALSTEENTKNLAVLEGQLLSLARTKPIPTVEIAGIAESAGALGVAQNNIASFTSTVADLAATTDLTTDKAATSLARLAGLTNLPAAGYDNLASAILETGRATAATEDQIVGIANRINGVGATFNVSAADIVGFSAAMASAGIQAESAGTSFQKTFADIQAAVSENGAQLDTWAQLSGRTSQEFAANFKKDAAGSFVEVIEGLARLQASGGDVNAVLASLGITESRQIRLLATMAAAQNSTTNESLKLTNIIGLSNDAFRDGTALSDIAGKKYQTLSAQVQILWNNFFELANQIGSVFLPALKFMVNVLQSVAAGFRVLPAPVKLVMAVFIGLLSGILGLLAAVLLIGPRFVLAMSAVRQFTASMAEAKGVEIQRVQTIAAVTGALERSAQAQAVATVAASQSIAAQKAAQAAELARAEALLANGSAQDRVNAAEAAYQAAFVARANARIALTEAETGARTATGAQWSVVVRQVQAAEAALLVTEQELAAATRVLDTASVDLLVTEAELAAVTRASAAADREATVAKEAHALAAKGVIAANTGATASTAANATANAGGLLGFLKLGKGAGGAAGEISTMSKMAGGLTKALGWAAVAMTAFTVVTGVMGSRARKAEEAQAKLREANKDLVSSLVEGGDAGKKAAEGFVKQEAEQRGLISTAKKLGISYSQLFKILAGSASAKEYKAFIEAVKKGNADGVVGARNFGNETQILNRIIANSKDEARAQGAQIDVLSGQMDDAADSARDLAAAQASADMAKQKAGASQDYISALFAEADAAMAVQDAERDLTSARGDSAGRALDVAKGELGLARARLNAAGSADAIRKAERDLSTARARQDEAVVTARNSLADAQDGYLDSLEKVEEAEEKLRDLQNPAGPEALTKAVLDLAEAQKNLRDANRQTSDAQWYLNYLMEEGAGARDIQVAKDAIADAALDVAKATEEQSDAEKELAKLQDPTERAKAQAKAERELAAARRDVENSLVSISSAERDLDSARSDQATNAVVNQAERDLAGARLDARDAVLAVRDAEAELADARSQGGSSGNEQAQAQADYEKALLDQARAIAETRKQFLLMSGEEVTASDEAHMLADALEGVIANIPDGAAKKKLQDFIGILRSVPDVPKGEADLGIDPTAETPIPQVTGAADIDPLKDLQTATKNPSMWSSIKDGIIDNIESIFSLAGSFILPALAGGAAEGSILGSFGGPVGMIAGAIIGLLVGLLVKLVTKNWDKIAAAVTGFVKKVPGYLMGLIRVIGDFFVKLPGRMAYAVGFLLGFIGKAIAFVITGIGKLFLGLGKAIWEALKAGLAGIQYLLSEEFRQKVNDGISTAWDAVTSADFWKGIWDSVYKAITGALGAAGSFLLGIGKDIIKGLWKGFSDAWPEGAKWLEDAWNSIIQAVRDFFGISSPSKLMAEIGGWVIQGFWNGITEAWNAGFEFISTMGTRIIEALAGGAVWLVDTGVKIITGLWEGMKFVWSAITTWVQELGSTFINTIKAAFGLVGNAASTMVNLGKDIFNGLWEGLKDIWGKIIDWIWKKVEDLPGVIKDFFGISSPSKLMMGFGKHIGEGLRIGLRESMDKTTKDFEKMAKGLNPEAIQEQFAKFGIDSFDIGAYTGTAALMPSTLGLPGRSATLPATDAPAPVVQGDTTHLHLAAITAANPSEIFDEFAWTQNIKTRGNK